MVTGSTSSLVRRTLAVSGACLLLAAAVRVGGLAAFDTLDAASARERLVSVLAGALAAPLAAAIGFRIAGFAAAAWAGTLLALSPIHVLASRTGASGPPLVLLLLAGLWLALACDAEGGRPRAVAAGATLGALAAAGVASFTAAALVVLAWLAWPRARQGHAGTALAAAVAAAALFGITGAARSPLDYLEVGPWLPPTTAESAARCSVASFTRVIGIEYHLVVSQARSVLPLTLAFTALGAWGAAALDERRRGLLAAGAVVPLGLAAAAALVTGHVAPLQADRLLGALPFCALLMSAGLAALRPRFALAAGAAVVLALALFVARLPG